jgi:tetratricopeptide (TPR) repeat protein
MIINGKHAGFFPNSFLLTMLLLAPNCIVAMGQELTSSQILDLLKQDKTSEAFTLAKQNQAEFEGELNFDLAYAASARAAGEYDQAVFAYERVLQYKVDSVEARFGLAVSYFDLGNIQGAKAEFSLLSQYSLKPETADLVARYLNVIEQREKHAGSYWQNFVQAGIGQDSNANNGVNEEFILIPGLGTVALFAQSREVDSPYLAIQGQALYVSPIDQLSRWYVSGSILHMEYDEELALSRTFSSLIAGYQTHINQFEVNVSAFFRPLWLDGDDYLDYYGVKGGINMPLFNKSKVGLDVSLATEDYSSQVNLNKDQTMAELWFEVPFTYGSHRLALRYGKEESEKQLNDFISRDLLGVGYVLAHRLNANWEYRFSADYLSGKYGAPHPLFAQVRDDSFIRAEFELTYHTQSSWRWISSLSYLSNDSNLPIFEFSRYRLWFGGRYDF